MPCARSLEWNSNDTVHQIYLVEKGKEMDNFTNTTLSLQQQLHIIKLQRNRNFEVRKKSQTCYL